MSTALTYYRVHPANEPVETVLDPRRADGWVASDEERDAQPLGVSACGSIDDLRRYIRLYSLSVQPGDVVLEMLATLSPDRDRDQHAERVIVESIVAVYPTSILVESEDQ